MGSLYTNGDKQDVIDFCKRHITQDNNGYCSLFYAATMAVQGKEFDGVGHRKAFINSCSSLITKTNEYRIKKEYPNGDVDIEKNPAYKKTGYFERHPIREKIFIALLSSFLTLCANLIVTSYHNRSQKQVDERQDQEIKVLDDSLRLMKINKK